MISKSFGYDPGYGVSATHWEIAGYQIDYLQQVMLVHVAGWVNSEARENGAAPLCIHAQEFSQKAVNECAERVHQQRVEVMSHPDWEILLETLDDINPNDYIFDFGAVIKEKDVWTKLTKMPFFAHLREVNE